MKIKFVAMFSILISGPALADVWKWVDAGGVTRYVETDTAIFTWLDENDKVSYGDSPDHEDAVAVQLVWHSAGSLADMNDAGDSESPADEIAEEAQAAKAADDEYYCKKATENYNAYKGAPRLYRTNDNGEREYLSKTESSKTLRESKAEMKEHCG